MIEKIYANLGKIAAIIFMVCIAVIFVIGFDVLKARADDLKRRGDIETIVKALDLYFIKFNRYPEAIDDWQGWDLSYDPKGKNDEFLKTLLENDLLRKASKDPLNSPSNHYRYKKFKAGEYGCEKPFYILQVAAFEMSAQNIGAGECPKMKWTSFAPNGFTVQKFE